MRYLKETFVYSQILLIVIKITALWYFSGNICVVMISHKSLRVKKKVDIRIKYICRIFVNRSFIIEILVEKLTPEFGK